LIQKAGERGSLDVDGAGRSSHLSLISHPREITELILQAAGYAE
jgi:hypothetical protein